MDDDLRLLRQTVANLEDALDRLESEGVGGEACIVGKTVSQGAYPTTAARVYACTVQVVTGTEAEGSTAVLTAQPDTVYAANLGTAIPPAGTAIPLDRVRRRWVFRYDG